MVNYSLPQFKLSKSKRKNKIQLYKDKVFGILTASVAVSFLAGIMASNVFYDQIENSLAQLAVNSPNNYYSAPLTQEELVVQIVEVTHRKSLRPTRPPGLAFCRKSRGVGRR